MAVETSELDAFGRPLIKEIDNLIQLGTAELFIDDPKNKSGLKSLQQYPIINAVTNSYIFYDRIPGSGGCLSHRRISFSRLIRSPIPILTITPMRRWPWPENLSAGGALQIL
ncbi:MAG: hypothetical protein MZV63_13910 [Marinilabiliales bacterium]|nr:hypothetical protein [Marinilabiliales bacterium]